MEATQSKFLTAETPREMTYLGETTPHSCGRNRKPAVSSFRMISEARRGLSGMGGKFHSQEEAFFLSLLGGIGLAFLAQAFEME